MSQALHRPLFGIDKCRVSGQAPTHIGRDTVSWHFGSKANETEQTDNRCCVSCRAIEVGQSPGFIGLLAANIENTITAKQAVSRI